MGNLVETNKWDETVSQIETTDLVEGGFDGAPNKQARSLANRTRFLKSELEKLAQPSGLGSLFGDGVVPGTVAYFDTETKLYELASNTTVTKYPQVFIGNQEIIIITGIYKSTVGSIYTAGQKYYCGENGNLITTENDHYIGQAIDGETLEINIVNAAEIQAATTTNAGKSRLATLEEARAGVIDSAVMTPESSTEHVEAKLGLPNINDNLGVHTIFIPATSLSAPSDTVCSSPYDGLANTFKLPLSAFLPNVDSYAEFVTMLPKSVKTDKPVTISLEHVGTHSSAGNNGVACWTIYAGMVPIGSSMQWPPSTNETGVTSTIEAGKVGTSSKCEMTISNIEKDSILHVVLRRTGNSNLSDTLNENAHLLGVTVKYYVDKITDE